jgi:hypothetical protein
MLDYAAVLLRHLVDTRQLDAMIIEAGAYVERVKRGVFEIVQRDLITYMPVSTTVFEEVERKYWTVVDTVVDLYANNIRRLSELINKIMNAKVGEAELASLGYFFSGAVYDEVVKFVRNIEKYSIKQMEEFVDKYLNIALSTCKARVEEYLAERGVVLRGMSVSPGMFRLLWIPQQDNLANKGIYDVPSSKVQVLALLRQLLPGLIDFDTGESEYTRIARLSQRLSDDYDLDTLIGIITRLYLDPSDADLPKRLDRLPKRYVPLVLLSHALSRKNGVLVLVDIEGDRAFIITYPKLPYTEVALVGD